MKQTPAMLEAKRRWNAKNPEKVRAQKQRSYVKNKATHNARTRAWYEKNVAKMMLIRAEERAVKAGVPFDLNESDIVIPAICPALGIALVIAAGKTAPSSPSLDRIVPALGYVKGNVRVISHRANSIKNDATFLELQLVANYTRAATAAVNQMNNMTSVAS